MLPSDRNWDKQAACKGQDTELFYPPQGAAGAQALGFCMRCSVREECLEWALERQEYGVWGGTTEFQRRAIRRARARQLA